MSEVKTTISESEFVGACKLHGKPTRAIWIFYAVAVLALIATAALGGEHARKLAILGLIGGLFGHLFVAQILQPRQARAQYRKYPLIQKPIEVGVLPNGVSFKSADGEGRLTWESIIKWRENSEFILVYPAPNLYYIIPKRLEASGLDVPAIAAGLEKNVGVAT